MAPVPFCHVHGGAEQTRRRLRSTWRKRKKEKKGRRQRREETRRGSGGGGLCQGELFPACQMCAGAHTQQRNMRRALWGRLGCYPAASWRLEHFSRRFRFCRRLIESRARESCSFSRCQGRKREVNGGSSRETAKTCSCWVGRTDIKCCRCNAK